MRAARRPRLRASDVLPATLGEVSMVSAANKRRTVFERRAKGGLITLQCAITRDFTYR